MQEGKIELQSCTVSSIEYEKTSYGHECEETERLKWAFVSFKIPPLYKYFKRYYYW